MSERQRCLQRLGLLLLLAAIMLPRLYRLGLYTTADEDRWLRNSANFYYALGQRDPANTYQLHHPGVTVMWAGTAGLLVTFPDYRGMGQGYFNDDEYNHFIRAQGIPQLDILVASRAFMVLQTALALLLAFYLLRRLLGFWPALAAVAFLALDPYYIGLTRLMHLDGLLTGWMLVSALAVFVYAAQGRHWRFLLFSAFAAGMALLTKSPALFLLPYTGLLLLLSLYWQRSWRWRDLWQHGALPLAVWLLLALAVFVAFWPAMWVDPIGSLADYYIKAFQYAVDSQHLIYYHGQALPGSQVAWSFYLETILWRATPVALLGFVLALVAYWQRWGLFQEQENRRLALALLAFVFFFLLFLQLSDKKFDRYLLPLYAPLDLLAALGWWAAAQRFQGAWKETRPAQAQLVSMLLVLALQLSYLLQAAPYYLTFYSPLMGGAERAQQQMLIGWGEGLNLAGEYLEAKPDAAELTVTSWYGNGPFSFYFSGSTYHIIGKADLGRVNLRYIQDSDYVVVYANQWQREYNLPLLQVLEQLQPEHTVWLQGLEMARIYAVADITPQQFEWLAQAAD